MKKILLAQIANSNLGDSVIADNTNYVLEKVTKGEDICVLNYNSLLRDVGQIKNVDAVIITSVILKHPGQRYYKYVQEIIYECEKWGIPVFLSNAGVEPLVQKDIDAWMLKRTVNYSCVKGISVRDDIDSLYKYYINENDNNKKIYSAYDIALWSKFTYSEAVKNISKSENKCIGLGITRDSLFADYNIQSITKEVQIEFWKSAINELEKKGFQWEIFTNGDVFDEQMANDVLMAVGHGNKANVPQDSKELISIITGYKGIIAGRMHSNIIAYSFGIPGVGFIWNQKLRFFAEKINHKERFLEVSDFDGVKAADRLIAALEEDSAPSMDMCESSLLPLKEFVETWVKKKSKEERDVSRLKFVLLADHLGGIRNRYFGTNTKEAFEASYNGGYTNFEADLRLTKDKKVVLVNRWHKDTYKLLGKNIDNITNPGSGLDYDEFMNLKYHNRFSPIDFDEFLSIIKNKTIREIVLSVGCPSEKDLIDMINIIKTAIESNQIDISSFILRLERRQDIEIVKEMLSNIRIMYYYVPPKEIRGLNDSVMKGYNEALDYCKDNYIEYIAVGRVNYFKDMIWRAKKEGIKITVFTDSKADTIIETIEAGADLVSSEHYDANYLKQLFYDC